MEPLYGVLDMMVLSTLLFGSAARLAIAGAIRDGSGDETAQTSNSDRCLPS